MKKNQAEDWMSCFNKGNSKFWTKVWPLQRKHEPKKNQIGLKKKIQGKKIDLGESTALFSMHLKNLIKIKEKKFIPGGKEFNILYYKIKMKKELS